jgi:hypothetical protein
MDLRETGLEGVYWIHLAQDTNRWLALVNTVMKLRVSVKGAQFLDYSCAHYQLLKKD